MNLANKLTIFRILIVPVMVIINYIAIPGEFLGISTTAWILEILFIIAAITDKLDGYIARSRNQITNFGKFLDPIADKVLVITTLIILVENNKIPGWIPAIIVFREFIVSGYRLIAIENGGKVIAANMWGKIKTVTQMIAIICSIIDTNNFCDLFRIEMDLLPFMINLITTFTMIACVIATIISGWNYIKDGKNLLK